MLNDDVDKDDDDDDGIYDDVDDNGSHDVDDPCVILNSSWS